MVKNYFYVFMMEDKRIDDLVENVNSILWNSLFGRRDSILARVLDEYMNKNKV